MNNPSLSISPITLAPVSSKSATLFQLVSKIQTRLLPQAISKKKLIINDVDKSLPLPADSQILDHVLEGMMSNAIFRTTNCCIRVESISQENGIELRVRNNGIFRYNISMHSLAQITNAAHKIGGNIDLRYEKKQRMSIVLSIASQKAA